MKQGVAPSSQHSSQFQQCAYESLAISQTMHIRIFSPSFFSFKVAWRWCSCQPSSTEPPIVPYIQPAVGNVTGWGHGWVWVRVRVGIFVPQKNLYLWHRCDRCDVPIMNVSPWSLLTTTLTNHRHCTLQHGYKTTWHSNNNAKGSTGWMCQSVVVTRSYLQPQQMREQRVKCDGIWGGDRHNQRVGLTRCAHKVFFYFHLLTITTAPWPKATCHIRVIPHNNDTCQWTPPHRPTPWTWSVRASCMQLLTTTQHDAIKTLVHALRPSYHSLTFRSSQGCTAVSIDTCTALARFIGHFWRHTPVQVGVPAGFHKPATRTRKNPCPWTQVWVLTGMGAGYSGKPQGSPWHSLAAEPMDINSRENVVVPENEVEDLEGMSTCFYDAETKEICSWWFQVWMPLFSITWWPVSDTFPVHDLAQHSLWLPRVPNHLTTWKPSMASFVRPFMKHAWSMGY